MEFPRGRDNPSRKIMEIPRGWGSTVNPPWKGKFCGVGSQLEKNLCELTMRNGII